MALRRSNINCQACTYEGQSRIGVLGIFLWLLVVLLIFFSFLFWPLFLVWPVVALLLLLLPVGQVCPVCRSYDIKRV
jgi:hypothetical protein